MATAPSPIDSQFMPTAEICVGGPQAEGAEGHRAAHQHASPRRSHQRQSGAFRPVVKRILAHENCVAWQRKVAEQAAANPPPARPARRHRCRPFTPMRRSRTRGQVDFGGETVHVRYFGPGHTSGDAVIFFEKANVIHAGDLLFRASASASRQPGRGIGRQLAVDPQKMAAAHGNDTAFIFGHGKDGVGPGQEVADVKYLSRLSVRRARSRPRRHQGGTVERRDRQGAVSQGFRRCGSGQRADYARRRARIGVRRAGEEVAVRYH